MTTIRVEQGDITASRRRRDRQRGQQLAAGGGGVDGAIHRAAGPELLAECRLLGGCPTGEARITRGYRLPARLRRPHGRAGLARRRRDEPALLAAATATAWRSQAHGLRSIAFPAICTGIYGYPVDRATAIALGETKGFVEESPDAFDEIVFVCFGRASLPELPRHGPDARDPARAAASPEGYPEPGGTILLGQLLVAGRAPGSVDWGSAEGIGGHSTCGPCWRLDSRS